MDIDPLKNKKNVVPDFAPLPSVDDVLKSSTPPTPAAKLDAVLATKSPALPSADEYYQSQLDAHDALIAQLHGGTGQPAAAAQQQQPDSALGTAGNPYGGSLPTDTSIYNGQDGNPAYGDVNRTAFNLYHDGTTRAHSIDARAPLSQAEVTSRNNNEQFFASRNGAVTREDMRWRSIFPNGGGPGVATGRQSNSDWSAQFKPQGLTVPAGVTSSSSPQGGQNNAGSATRAIVKPIDVGQAQADARISSFAAVQRYQEPSSVASTTFSSAPDRTPYIGGANGDVTKDFVAGGRYSSAKAGTDPTLDPNAFPRFPR